MGELTRKQAAELTDAKLLTGFRELRIETRITKESRLKTDGH